MKPNATHAMAIVEMVNMLSQDFDNAVTEGYARLVGFAEQFTSPTDVYSPKDIVHNALLWFRVRALATFEWRSQAEWECIIQKNIIWQVLDSRKGRSEALNFKDAVLFPEQADEEVDVDSFEVSEAFILALDELDHRSREVVLAVLAGFTQEQVADLLGVSRPLVSQIWRRALESAREYMEPLTSDDNR